MSIECLNQALKIKGLTPTKKLILVLLANYSDEKGTCYPSYKHIADIIGLKTVKGIQKAIKEFEELGLLRVEHRILENGSYTSNKYHLTLGRVLKEPSTEKDTTLGSPVTLNTKDNTKTNNIDDNDIETFNTFWNLYPRRVNKHQAKKCFFKLNSKDYEKVIYATKVFSQEQSNTEERFIPHASTWLNQKRYEDYVDKKIKNKTLNNLAG